MYVNCRGKTAEENAIFMNGTKMKRDLPHSRPGGSLYEILIAEKNFVRNGKQLASFLSDPEVEGLYESLTPLWFRAVLKMGCVARPALSSQASQVTSKGERVFKLEDLDFVNIIAHPYLQPSVAVYRRMYLFCSVDKSRNSGLAALGLFIVDGSTGDGYVAPKKRGSGSAKTVSLNNDHNPYGDQPTDTPASKAVKPLSGRAFIWLVNGNKNSIDSRPPFQRIYRNFQPG
jgi:hypothetical protein